MPTKRKIFVGLQFKKVIVEGVFVHFYVFYGSPRHRNPGKKRTLPPSPRVILGLAHVS